MKAGMSLQEFCSVIKSQDESKHDFIVHPSVLTFNTDKETRKSKVTIPVDGNKVDYVVTPLFHQQLAEKLAIPSNFYKRLQDEAPEVLDTTVNGLFKIQEEKRTIRTLEAPYRVVPVARAFLSERYRDIPNRKIVETVFSVIGELQGDVFGGKIETCNVSETLMHLKFTSPRLEMEIRKGDPVQLGLMLTNSEVGKRSFVMSPFLNRLVCTNGAVMTEFSMSRRKYHVGRAMEIDADVIDLTLDEDGVYTLDKDKFWDKTREFMRNSLNVDVLKRSVAAMRNTLDIRIESKPDDSVGALSRVFGLTAQESDIILRHLIESADFTGFGLIQAITRASQDLKDYDRATHFETLGGELASMSRADWKQIVTV